MSQSAFVLTLLLLACSNGSDNPGSKPPEPAAPAYSSAQVFPALRFSNPVELVNAADGTNRLFVVEQAGTIRAFDASTPDPQTASLFLDITANVRSGGEMGLLGLAFHPDFAQNGLFFVNYTRDNPRQSVIARYRVSNPASGSADSQSETILLTYDQPFANHNGGTIHFGPDGYLYIGTGDGGSGGDPRNFAQNKASLLGKILRIDVNSTEKGNYGIPADNPFVSSTQGDRGEIYAYGLRNPWRISFDAVSGELWTGDVGQNSLEEINIIEKGGNYGWRLMEANECYSPRSNCQQPGLKMPVWYYPHTDNNISITGGYVYRGKKLPGLAGKYVYGDYASGRVWALEKSGIEQARNTLLLERFGAISTFGVDERNELYIVNYNDGKLYTLKSN